MKSWISKFISFVLVLTLLIQCAPIFAITANRNGEAAGAAVNDALDIETAGKKEFTAADVVEEEPFLREETVKHFRMSDGSYVAVDYGYAIHYKDENGAYQDIDNSLVASESQAAMSRNEAASESRIATTEREEAITFSANSADDGALVTIGGGNRFVKMTPYALQPVDEDNAELAAEGADNLEIAEAALNAELAIEEGLDISAAEVPELSTYVEEITEGIELNKADGVSTVMAADEAAEVLVKMQPLQMRSAEASIQNSVRETEENISFSDAVFPEKSVSSLFYANIFPGVDLEYNLIGNDVKENIIVKEAADSYVYPFVIELASTMTMEMQDDGSVLIYDGDAPAYVICAPYMYDAENESSTDVSYIIKALGTGKYLLTTVADSDWINAEGRSFPVVIDPSVTVYNANPTTSVSYLDSNYATGDLRYSQIMYIGKAYTNSKFRVVARVDTMPTLPNGSTIVGAQLNFNIYEYSNNGEQALDIVVKPMAPSNFWDGVMSWNNQPELEDVIVDYATIGPGMYTLSFDITREFLKWNADFSTNHGLMIYTPEEDAMTSTHCSFISMYKGTYNPVVMVNYRNTVGVENYYTYQVQNVGRAGTVYVGDYSGGLTLVNNIGYNASTVAPVGLSLVYNSAMSNHNYQDYVYAYDYGYFGYGWKLDGMQSVHTADDGTHIIYIDADGTSHYFSYDPNLGLYADEDGLGLTLAKDGSNYSMWDRYGRSWYFYSNMLYIATDANGNQISYDIGYGAVSQIRRKLSSQNVWEILYTFTYEPGTYYLTSITDSVGNVTSFSYTAGSNGRYLTGITYPDGKTASYAYDDNGKLIRVTDHESNYSINYTYASGGNVSSIEEKSGTVSGSKILVSGTAGGVQAYCYPGADRKVSRTQFLNESAARTCGCTGACTCDDDNIITYNVFDYYGHTINTYSTNADGSVIYGVNSSKYVTNNGTSGQNNRVSIASSVGVQPENFAADGGFESGNTIISSVTGGTATRSNTTKHTGNYSLRITQSANASESTAMGSISGLANGTYIVSAYVKFDAATTSGGVAMNSSLANGVRVKKPISGDAWDRISTVANAVNGVLSFEIEANEISELFVDDLQVEPCFTGSEVAPSNVNLLTNGNFEVANSGWGTFTRGTGEKFTAAKLVGSIAETRELTQNVPINLDAGQTYMLSAWAKASSGPLDENSTFELQAIIHYADNTTETHKESFCADYTGWQFLAVPVVPKEAKTVRSIDVKLAYNNNINNAYFAKVALVREAAASYKYNSNGDLVASNVTDNAGQAYTYSGADLIGQTTKGGGNYEYTYDSKHNVTGVTHDTTSMAVTYGLEGNATSSTLTSTTDAGKITSSSTYTSDKNRVASVTDARGKTTNYTYAAGIYTQSATPSAVTDANGVTVNTVLNPYNGRTTQSGIAGEVSLVYGYNSDGTLDSITRNSRYTGNALTDSQTYNLEYTDNFDRMESVAVGTRTLASYIYANNGSGLLERMTYGNQDTIDYDYDVLERLSKLSYNDRGDVEYFYNGMGALAKVVDDETGHSYYYNYDILGRLVSMTEQEGTGNSAEDVQNYSASYDDANRLGSYRYRVASPLDNGFGALRSFAYTYSDTDGTLTKMVGPSSRITYTYDGFNRLDGKTTYNATANGTAILNRSFDYLQGATADSTTTLVSSLTYKDNNNNALRSFSYSYDNVGNISTITETVGNTSETRSYTYDKQGQMLTEKIGSTTYTYSYDSAGNIRSKTSGGSTKSYTYGDSNWKDLLTKYDGLTINYDGVGNPTNWRGLSSLTWESGRRLMSATTTSGTNLSYTYDMDGLRLSKTVGGVTHNYVWQGSSLVSEQYGTKTLEFFYDETGVPYAFYYADSANASNNGYYFYVTNLQGDIVGIVDATGASVATYKYNAWGAIISTTDNDASGLVNINPLRYRGYYYDSETRLYYLQSRYYDPEVCRFINGDGYVSTGIGFAGCNMFAYCNNNPANYCDYSGNSPFTRDLDLLDYKTIHEQVQESISVPKGWYMEVSVKGHLGRGRLDLFDAVNNMYYEVKSKGAADKSSTKTQMEKYDVALICGVYSSFFEQDSPATRGTEQVSGEFRYGFWDVKYEYKEPGLIVYTPTYNDARAADYATVAIGVGLLGLFGGVIASFIPVPIPA